MKAKRILASVLSVALLLQLSPLGVLALDESLPQTPQVSTVQENLDPVPTEEPAPTAEPIPEETAVPMAAGGGACAGRCGNACPGAVCGTHGNP